MLYTQNDLDKVTRFNYGIFVISMSIFHGFLAVSLRRKGFCVWEDAYRNFHAGVPLFEHLFGLPSLKGTFRVYQFENRFFCRKSCPWQAVRRLFSGARKKIQIGFRECISLVYSPPQRVVLLRRCFYVHDSTFQLNIANGARGHLDWDVFYQKLWATISASKKVCFDPSGLMVATVGGSRW